MSERLSIVLRLGPYSVSVHSLGLVVHSNSAFDFVLLAECDRSLYTMSRPATQASGRLPLLPQIQHPLSRGTPGAHQLDTLQTAHYGSGGPASNLLRSPLRRTVSRTGEKMLIHHSNSAVAVAVAAAVAAAAVAAAVVLVVALAVHSIMLSVIEFEPRQRGSNQHCEICSELISLLVHDKTMS